MITLKTLAEASAQDVFDHVVRHLGKQGVRSMEEDGDTSASCAYRGVEGRMCAAGCLVADDEYQKDWEGLSWEGLLNRGAVPPEHGSLIDDLQLVHDTKFDDWSGALRITALKYNLDDAVIKEAFPNA